MRDSIAVRKWLDIAASGVRFAPDREEVKAELLEHIEDKTADLMRIFPGMEEKEAQERALSGMGDPWALKSELAKVHTPWLGWLWTVSRVFVWAVLAVTLLAAVARMGDFDALGYEWRNARAAQAAGRALYEDGVPDWEGERLAVYSVDAETRLDRAELSVSKAARWRELEKDILYLRLRITWDRPWEKNQMALSSLWAEDDLGNAYEISWSRSHCTGWNWCQRDLALEGVPREAEALYIHHSLRDGLNLTVNLTREAVR